MPNFKESYLGQLVQIRNLTGKDYKFLVPATRAIIRDPEGRILFVQRKDNGKWVMPSGSQELGETIYDCMKREVWEESGLYVASATEITFFITWTGQAFSLVGRSVAGVAICWYDTTERADHASLQNYKKLVGEKCYLGPCSPEAAEKWAEWDNNLDARKEFPSWRSRTKRNSIPSPICTCQMHTCAGRCWLPKRSPASAG